MTMFEVAAVGLLTGLHAATWGAYKDSPFEGFDPVSFLRSIALGVAVALGLAAATDLEQGHVLLLVGVAYAVERLATEWWKSILREDDQSVYAIPMRLAVHGRTIDSATRRYGLGAGVLTGLGVACWLTPQVQATLPPLPVGVAIAVGSIGGWLTAVGGAWKDAPVEGFSGWKFLRSPGVSLGWAAVLSGFTTDWLTLTVAAAGWSVISIETYKTFLTGDRPPGKFDGKAVRFAVAEIRSACRGTQIALYAVLATACVAPLAGTAGSRPGEATALAAIGLAASMASGLVLAPPRSRAAHEPSAVRVPSLT